MSILARVAFSLILSFDSCMATFGSIHSFKLYHRLLYVHLDEVAGFLGSRKAALGCCIRLLKTKLRQMTLFWMSWAMMFGVCKAVAG